MFKKHSVLHNTNSGKMSLLIGITPVGSPILMNIWGNIYVDNLPYSSAPKETYWKVFRKVYMPEGNYPKIWKKYLSDFKRKQDEERSDKEYEEIFI